LAFGDARTGPEIEVASDAAGFLGSERTGSSMALFPLPLRLCVSQHALQSNHRTPKPRANSNDRKLPTPCRLIARVTRPKPKYRLPASGTEIVFGSFASITGFTGAIAHIKSLTGIREKDKKIIRITSLSGGLIAQSLSRISVVD
jgi:hypothetical protein